MLRRISVSIIVIAVIAGGRVFAAGDVPTGNIHPKFRLSFSERFRIESWDNTVSLADSLEDARVYTRTRTSIMGQWFASPQLELGAKLTNEFRHYFAPEDIEFSMNELFVDQLYARGSYDRFTLTFGRQNIMLGEGFVVCDGGPLDGSRSAYFNAARLDVKPCPLGTVTLFYFYQPVYDKYLPLINDQEKSLVENDEQSFGAYLSRDFGKHNIQAYYIRKNIIDTLASEVESGINTIGGRLAMTLNEKWSFTTEAALQFGSFGDNDRMAFGGYAYVDYKTGWPNYLPARITVGQVYLSGDRNSTDKWEGWEPLFGRWPKWSESYIYTLLNESGAAYWTNFASIYLQAHFEITPDIGFHAEYQRLRAPRAYRGSPFASTGNNRGDMFAGRLTYTISEYFSGHVVWEHFNPGNYYWDDADVANWLRFQLMLSMQ